MWDTDVLFPLADAFGMELEVVGDTVRGSVSKSCAIGGMGGAIFPVDLKVLSSTLDISGEDVGLLMQGPGDLLVYVFFTSYLSLVEVSLIDRVKLTHKHMLRKDLTGIFEGLNVRSYGGARRRLVDGMVASFYRKSTEAVWKTKDVSVGVDQLDD